MKRILLMFAIVIAVASCSKKIDTPPTPTTSTLNLRKDNTALSFSLKAGPRQLIGQFLVDAKGLPSDNFIRGYLVDHADSVENIYIVIKGTTDSIVSPAAQAGTTKLFNDYQYPNLDNTTTYTVLVYADVPDKVMKFSPGLELYYSTVSNDQAGKPDISTGLVIGQSVTVNESPKLSVTASATAYSPRLEALSAEKTNPFMIHLVSTGKFSLTNVVVANALPQPSTAHVLIELYRGTTLVGSGTLAGDSVFVSCNLSIAENENVDLAVKATFSAGVETLDRNRKLLLRTITYKAQDGTVATQDFSLQSGDVYVWKSLPVFGTKTVSETVQNGVPRVWHALTVTSAQTGDAIALKQYAYHLTFADGGVQNGPWIDSIEVTDINNPSLVFVLTNIYGNRISYITSADTLVYVTVAGGNELVATTTHTLELHGIGRNFGSGIDADAVAVDISGDHGAPYGHYLSSFSTSGLYYGAALSPTQASSGGIPSNIIWSDRSGTPHGSFFGNSVPDWTNFELDQSLIQNNRSQ